MMLTSLAFKMAVVALLGLLMEACFADVGPKQTNHRQPPPALAVGHTIRAAITDRHLNQFVPQNTPTIFDNGTLLAPNVHGEMVLHTIVDLTWEVDIPNTSNKINITGTANKVIDYINTNHPDYVWPDVSKLNTASLGKTLARRGPKPNCDVFSLAPYPKAHEAQSGLEMIPYTLHLGPGPRTCGQAQCVNDLQGRHAAIWWCNDVSKSSSRFSCLHLICTHNYRY